ncbi:MAG: radical SAM protein [Treponema sp.]|nr:radical SAM protein [Treponema sp.]
MDENQFNYYTSICVTHNCNLNCIYCYQKHSQGLSMSLEKAQHIMDFIFNNAPPKTTGVHIGFIGGEPLLEFDLIKDIFSFVRKKNMVLPYYFFASTNGTILTEEMKQWFQERKQIFILGLSLDGRKETHDINRSNSFDKIDIGYFIETWPQQGVKMTLSEYSLPNLARDIKYLHKLGIKNIYGVNLYEGNIDWTKDEYIEILIPQLKELVEFYTENNQLSLNQLFDAKIDYCDFKPHERKKWCGIGESTAFFDIDGKKYPCPLVTPMTFQKDVLDKIMKVNFADANEFIDEECYNNCYIYPICPTCSGGNYLVNKSFKTKNKSKCRIQKLVALFIADLHSKRIIKTMDKVPGDNDQVLFHTIEAIKGIRSNYLNEYKKFFDNSVVVK